MGFNGWQHDGRMPGSAAMLVRLDNGLEMAVVVNKVRLMRVTDAIC